MYVYLASRFSRFDELNEHRAELAALGIGCTSRWLNGNHRAENNDLFAGAAAERFAVEDLTDVRDADVIVSFTEEPRSSASRGGRHVEYGYALGLGKMLYLVGPRENVFHCLSQVSTFDDWPAALGSLTALAKVRG